MAVILDADVIIRGEKGTFDLEAWLSGQPDELFAVAAITVAELWHGVEKADASHQARRLRYLQSVMEALPVHAYTFQTALGHARIWAQLEAAGRRIGAYPGYFTLRVVVQDGILPCRSLASCENVRHRKPAASRRYSSLPSCATRGGRIPFDARRWGNLEPPKVKYPGYNLIVAATALEHDSDLPPSTSAIPSSFTG